MVRNYFYFIVGLLCLLFAFTHTWNGLKTALPVLDSAGMENGTKTIFIYIWHIIGVENLVFGIALLVMAFEKDRAKGKFTAWVIIVILIMRSMVIVYFTLSDNGELRDLLPDTIAILIVVVLLFFGTKVKSKPIAD